MQISDNNYIVIQAWMITKLGLSGAELMCYAAIYGFSQANQGAYRGGVDYLMEWTGASKPTIINTLARLCRRGLIAKSKVGRCCEYTAVEDPCGLKEAAEARPEEPEEKVKNFNLSKKIGKAETHDRLNNLTQIGKEILPNNKIINNRDINTPPLTPPQSPAVPEGIPTREEVRSFAKSKDIKFDPDEFYDHYEVLHWKLYGKPIRDWQALFCKWATDPERMRSGRQYNRARDGYMQGQRYDRETLRKLGISFGEEFYDEEYLKIRRAMEKKGNSQ